MDEDRALADISAPILDLADRLARGWQRYLTTPVAPVDHHGVDEASILNRWLFRQAGHRALIPLPTLADGVKPPWSELALRALSLSDGELNFADVYRGDEGADEVVE